MDVKIEESWKARLQQEFEKPYFKVLTDFVRNEYGKRTIYPPARLIFNAFDSCPFDEVKVVIVGQDPYHQPGQAHGLCFSVNDGCSCHLAGEHLPGDSKRPGKTDSHLGKPGAMGQAGRLAAERHADRQANRAGSHQGKGWEEFTDAAIHQLATKRDHLVFILWGAYAQRKEPLSTRGGTLCSNHRTPRRYPLTAASSVTSTLAKRTIT